MTANMSFDVAHRTKPAAKCAKKAGVKHAKFFFFFIVKQICGVLAFTSVTVLANLHYRLGR